MSDPQEAPALDELPESLDAAEAEHAQVMQEIQQAQQQIQQAQQFIEAKARRGIFLEGVIAGWSKPVLLGTSKNQPNRATRRATVKKGG